MAAGSKETFVESLKDPATHSLSPLRFAAALHIDASELARLARVHRNTFLVNPCVPRLQEYMRDIIRIVLAAASLRRTKDEVLFWLANQPIASLEHKTALRHATEGRAQAVVDYLESIESGYVG